MSSLVGRPSPHPGLRPGVAPLRVQRSDAWIILALGLGLMALASGPPAVALRGEAPEIAMTIVAFTCTAALLYTAAVLAYERRWLTTTVLVVLSASGRETAVGRLRRVDARRLVARLETCTGVPVEEPGS